MTKEEAISVIENEIQIDVRLCTDEQVKRFQEALYMAISALGAMHTDHFREITKMVPLILEELKSMEGQKVLLYRMKSTEPLELGTVKKHGDALGDAGMLAYHELYLETWVAFSYQVQEKPDFGKPLTLEQLRGMDGQPVWVDFTGSNFERPAGWFILRSIENGEAYLVGKTSVYKALEYYGKVWRAYTYPPAHIDREAWTAEWIYPENEFNLPRCSKCGCNSKDAQYSHKDNFCPKCGRAMTQEGRAIMENRLSG